MERVNTSEGGGAGDPKAELLLQREKLARFWLGRPRIIPPRALVSRPSDAEELARHVRPHWEGFRQMLELGGYGDALRMLERLQEAREGLRDRHEALEARSNAFLALASIIGTEAQEHGSDKTLGESYPVPPEAWPNHTFLGAGGEDWRWRAVGAYDVTTSEKAPVSCSFVYHLEPPELYFPALSAAPVGVTMHWGEDETWGEIYREVVQELQLYDTLIKHAAREAEIVEFRASVLGAVLWEVERFGVVAPLTDEEVADLFEEEIRRRVRLKDLRKDRDVFFSELKHLHFHEKLSQRAALDRLIEEIGGLPEFYKQGDDTDEEGAKDSLVRSFHNWRKRRPE